MFNKKMYIASIPVPLFNTIEAKCESVLFVTLSRSLFFSLSVSLYLPYAIFLRFPPL